ncbi:MAG: DUF4349 domain-containing protein, partial [Burkholderiales bacterium]|nr:DUF4349 domain-containing protein [Phycisphaerae bacterium]
MTMELPPELQQLDDTLSGALRQFAPPQGLADRAIAGLKRRLPLPNPFRMRLSPMVVKSAAAAAVVAMLGSFGYLADQRMNGSRRAAIAEVDESSSFYLGVHTRDRESNHPVSRPPSTTPTGEKVLYADGHVDWDKADWVGAQNDSVHFARRFAKQEGDAKPESSTLSSAPTSSDRYDAGGRLSGQFPSLQSASRERAKGVSDIVSDSRAANKPSDGNDTILLPSKELREVEGLKLNRFTPANYGVMSDKVLSLNGANTYTGGTTITAGIVSNGGIISGRFEPSRGAKVAPTGSPEQNEPRSSSLEKLVTDAPLPSVGLAIAQDAAGPGTSAPQPVQVEPSRKVIRSGDIEFEVDSFDSSLMTVTKLAIEDGGFVASTDSAKLPNGKTRGMVSVRVPPNRLDAYVLKLRGLGDLKTQKITSQDVSKSYSDTESALRAARAMESRLLEMIAKGQGAIKDLLLAEKELGVWREKIEQHEGQKRYYDSLISLSTLNITLQERDIKSAAGAIETERISAGVETDDVEKARTDVIKAIDDAGGRIITSDLKKLDAGQFAATISAEIAPDKTGPIVDRLKQLGKVARLDIDRKQTTTDGQSAPLPGAHVEKKPSVVTISLYNLANVAPRLTTTVTLASSDVEASYRTLLAAMETAGGRAVSSQLQRPRADQVTASLQLESPSAQAAAM